MMRDLLALVVLPAALLRVGLCSYESCSLDSANEYAECIQETSASSCNAKSKCEWCTGFAVAGEVDDMSDQCLVTLDSPCKLQGEVIGYGCPTSSPSVTFAPTPTPEPTTIDGECSPDVLISVDACGDSGTEAACAAASPKVGSCSWCSSDSVCTLSVYRGYGCEVEMEGQKITYGTGCDTDFITSCGIADTVTFTTCGAETENGQESCEKQADCVWCADATLESATDESAPDELEGAEDASGSACLSVMDAPCMISGEKVGCGCEVGCDTTASDDDGDASGSLFLYTVVIPVVVLLVLGVVVLVHRVVVLCFCRGKKSGGQVAPK